MRRAIKGMAEPKRVEAYLLYVRESFIVHTPFSRLQSQQISDSYVYVRFSVSMSMSTGTSNHITAHRFPTTGDVYSNIFFKTKIKRLFALGSMHFINDHE